MFTYDDIFPARLDVRYITRDFLARWNESCQLWVCGMSRFQERGSYPQWGNYHTLQIVLDIRPLYCSNFHTLLLIYVFWLLKKILFVWRQNFKDILTRKRHFFGTSSSCMNHLIIISTFLLSVMWFTICSTKNLKFSFISLSLMRTPILSIDYHKFIH